MKKFFAEFKAFALKGNVINLAVGVIIGAAFQAIITSLVNDIISPLIGCFAKMDFSEFSFKIGEAEIKYGSFLTAVINFLIMAFVIFLFVKWINQMNKIVESKIYKQKQGIIQPTTKECPFCCQQISLKATRCPNCTSVLENQLVTK